MPDLSEKTNKLIAHLGKQAIKSQTLEETSDFEARKKALLGLLETHEAHQNELVEEKPGFIKSLRARFQKPGNKIDFQERLETGLSRTSTIKIILYRLTADSLGDTYNTECFDTKSYSLGLSYDLLARKTVPWASKKIYAVEIPAYVNFALQGVISANDEWREFARPFIHELLTTEDDQLKRTSAHFPLLPVLVSEDPKETARELILQHYGIDSSSHPQDVLSKLIGDRIEHTRIPKDLFTSLYALPTLSFIPTELIYLSTLIDFEMPNELETLKIKLTNLPIIKDDLILALERYLQIKKGPADIT